jgi:hypothetical protein
MFLINLIYAVLIGYLLLFLQQRYQRYIRHILVVCLLLIFINSYPFWTGSFFNQEFITIPPYWYTMSDYYHAEDSSGNILFMPAMPFSVYTFTAQRAKATTFFRPLVNDNQINNIDIIAASTNPTLQYLYRQYDKKTFNALLGFYGIPSVLLQQDVDWVVYKAKDPKKVKEALDKNLGAPKLFQ